VTSLGGLFKICPKKWLSSEGAEAQGFIDDYFWLKRFNILPAEGAKLDQDSRFVSAVNVIEAESQTLKSYFETKANRGGIKNKING
tara:strand:- start:523 stop:780 length:258 start_codon:yes stop_codon:yes gene_type:complete